MAGDRLKVLQLLYQYRHLNREDLTDLPCTDSITHRVRIKPGINPASVKSQKRWPPYTEWWLRKLIQDGLEGGIDELTEPANTYRTNTLAVDQCLKSETRQYLILCCLVVFLNTPQGFHLAQYRGFTSGLSVMNVHDSIFSRFKRALFQQTSP